MQSPTNTSDLGDNDSEQVCMRELVKLGPLLSPEKRLLFGDGVLMIESLIRMLAFLRSLCFGRKLRSDRFRSNIA